MKHINRYLSNKITNKKFSNDLTEIVKELINVYFFDSDDAKKEIYENMIMNSAFKNQDFKDFRIFGWKDGHYCDKDVEKVLTPFQSYDVIEVYTKLMEEYDGDLVEDIVDISAQAEESIPEAEFMAETQVRDYVCRNLAG